MVFRLMSVVMCSIAAMFVLNVGSEHAFYAALIPAAAALGLALLAAD